MRITPSPRFGGRFRLPGDKSVSHRLALLGALARGTTTIHGFARAADCASTLSCLGGLGVRVEQEGDRVRIAGEGPESLRAPASVLDAGNSGSTVRMLAGVLAGRPFCSTLTGDESLRRRPMERVAEPLRAMGARIATTGGRLPLTIHGGPLRGITWEMPVASAQVKTAILLAGLQAEGATTVVEPAPSRDHTERWLPVFGAEVEREGLRTRVRRSELTGREVTCPGDASSAAFLVVAGLAAGEGGVRLDGVLLSPGRTAFLDVLRSMGGDLQWGVEDEAPEPVGWIEARPSRLQGVTVDPALVPALVDEIPALAAAAARAAGGTFQVSGAAELRVKESDRLAALAEGLSALGAAVREQPDGLSVAGGGPLRGASVRTHGDHRIAMALAVAALGASGETTLDDPACVAVSFPGFFDVLARGAAG